MKLSDKISNLTPVEYRWAKHKELAEECRQLEAMTEWQPIESAPKDGTYVDLWLTYHSKKLDGYCVPDTYFKDGWWHYDFCDEDYELDSTDCTITHWKPVTKPPQSD